MDVFQKLKTIYKDFAKAVESITVGVQQPPRVSLLMCLCLTDEVIGTLKTDSDVL